ncbi:MAG: TolC family protein, partial [Fimbriimonadales bacterium]
MRAWSLCLLSIALSAGFAQKETPNTALTLNEAIQIALENNPALKISERSLQKAKNGVREAQSASNFQIQGTGTYTRFDRVAKAQFGPQTIRLGNIENRTARISLTQPIDISGIIRNAVRSARLGESIAELDFRRARNDL